MATSRAQLEKLTTPKLRELALEKYPSLSGVSGMKKEELVEGIIAEEVRLGLRPKEEEDRRAMADMGVIQQWTPSVEALVVPDIDESLDEQGAKRRFWEAFRVLGEWHDTQAPF